MTTTFTDMHQAYVRMHKKEMQERLKKALKEFCGVQRAHYVQPTPEMLQIIQDLAEQLEVFTGERPHSIIYEFANNQIPTTLAIKIMQRELNAHQRPWVNVHCLYYSGYPEHLKCAVHPSVPCRECREYQEHNNG